MAEKGARGVGADSSGYPVPDPTSNVLQLVDAAVKRLDDVIAAAVKRADDLQAAHERRLNDLLETKIQYLEKMNGQRDLQAIELREAESARIDAIRMIDVGAVQQAGAVAATQASALAAQVAVSAETLRNQVAAAASASAAALSAALEPIIRDVQDLRKTQYEQAGQKAQVVETRSSTAQSSNLLVGVLGLLLTAIIFAIGIYASRP